MKGAIGVPGGEPGGVAQLGENLAFRFGGGCAGVEPGVHRVGDRRAQLAFDVGALPLRQGANGGPDVAVDQRVHEDAPCSRVAMAL